MVEKKKKNQPVEPALSCKNIVAVIAIIVSLVVILFPLWFALIWGELYYNRDNVLLTCEYLQLSPNSEFCSHPTTSDDNHLEAALLADYPIGQTSFSDLFDQWHVQFELTYESCETPKPVSANAICPMQSCGNYSCYAYLPVETITIQFDARGMVTDYSVPGID